MKAILHVYELEGVKSAQLIINGSPYQIDVDKDTEIGDREVTVEFESKKELDMDQGRSLKERIRIHLAAKRKLGMKDLSHYLFMQQCMEQMVNNGEADTEDDARDICELLWDEGGDPEEFD